MIWPFKRKPSIEQRAVAKSQPVAIESTPDSPVPFGYKTVWWAVRGADISVVAHAIHLQNPQHCNWSSGVRLSYAGGLFVAPAIDDWILICGRDLPPNSEDAAKQVEDRLCVLSAQFGEAQAFASHRIVDFHLWARARDGVLTRGYGYLGESGVTFWDEGADDDENELGFDFVDTNDDLTEDELDTANWPSEDSVMDVARVWSICPVELGEHLAPSVGLTGEYASLFLDA